MHRLLKQENQILHKRKEKHIQRSMLIRPGQFPVIFRVNVKHLILYSQVPGRTAFHTRQTGAQCKEI